MRYLSPVCILTAAIATAAVAVSAQEQAPDFIEEVPKPPKSDFIEETPQSPNNDFLEAPEETPPADDGEFGPFPDVKVRPLDEADRDAEFEAFRKELINKIKLRDIEFLVNHVADDIKFSFGGGHGKADFIKQWELDTKPRRTALWNELLAVLELGGAFHRAEFTAPYVFMLFPSQFDGYKYGAITGRNVNIREQPRSTSRSIGKESYTVVRLLPNEEKEVVEVIGNESHPWVKIGLPAGEIGYVYGKYVRSPIDYRATFRPIDGTWKMVSFLAGD